MIDFLCKVPLNNREENILDCFIEKPVSLSIHETDVYTLITWGDPIYPRGFFSKKEKGLNVETLLKDIAGHFYYLLQDKDVGTISLGNSLFGILPLYYAYNNNEIYISNSVLSFANYLKLSINRRFILENVLFNYPLFNITCFNEVLLLPTNHAIEIKSSALEIKEVIRIEELFIKKPLSKRKSLQLVVESFLDNVKKYYSSDLSLIALTGGFDGRTLVASANNLGLPFKTFTFGAKGSSDLLIASNIAAISGINHECIDLDDEYVSGNSFKFGLDFIEGSNGTATFARAHYQYSISKLSNNTDTFITGNFGSEVFRAAHVAGVVINKNLYSIFNATDYNEAIKLLDNASEWQWINKPEFEECKQDLYCDLRGFPAFASKYAYLSKNQRFYKVVFDEVFRKYFGAEMVNQFKIVKNRTPFLDYNFLKVVLNSKYAGVHSDFFTNNPIKRFKGQVVYAYILKRTNNKLFKIMTDKGYRPSDILSYSGSFKILFSYLKKKVFKVRKGDNDPYSVSKSFEYNRPNWKGIAIDPDYFNVNKIHEQEKGDAGLYTALSQAWWLSKVKKIIINQ